MFFSTELLSKRDSGYGLLWLAATLGSTSTLKKLHRRSVLTANIIELCTLISEPLEPLALRLSSNLMVGVVRVFKMKHEIFETDVGNCVTSLKKSLQDLHAMDGGSLEMAQPNGLREDALNLAVDPAMMMATEFDGMIDDWDMIFRRIAEEQILDNNDEFNPSLTAKAEDPSSEPRHNPNKKKLHQLDESHDHLFSSSFLQSFSGEIIPLDDVSSAQMNDVLFDLGFGDPDVGLGEEMERDLEEAWNMKVNREDERGPATENIDFAGIPMDDNIGIGDLGEHTMEFIDDPFVPGIEFDAELQNRVASPENNQAIGPTWLHARHTPPPRDQLPPRSILSRRTGESGVPNQRNSQDHALSLNGLQAEKLKKRRKKVMLIDPTTELSDEVLRFHKDNYLKEMMKQRRDSQDKKEQREGRRRVEEELWAPPKDFLAPELVELWNQCVTYPVKAREAAWRKELDELQHPPKKRRIAESDPSKPAEANIVEMIRSPEQEGNGFDFGMNLEMDIAKDVDGDYGRMGYFDKPSPLLETGINSGSRRSSDDPGQPRQGPSRPPSLPGSSLVGPATFDISRERISNSLFPWDNAGVSSSDVAFPGPVGLPVGDGGNDLALNLDSVSVRVRRGSKSSSARESPAIQFHSGGEADLAFDVGLEIREASIELNPGDTQESENMVILEKNSFNFLEYAKMHMATDSGPLFFSDIAPIESSSTRIAAEGFYHCLALATKDLIRLEQNEPYGPIQIVLK